MWEQPNLVNKLIDKLEQEGSQVIKARVVPVKKIPVRVRAPEVLTDEQRFLKKRDVCMRRIEYSLKDANDEMKHFQKNHAIDKEGYTYQPYNDPDEVFHRLFYKIADLEHFLKEISSATDCKKLRLIMENVLDLIYAPSFDDDN